jgi:hypothetical protein
VTEPTKPTVTHVLMVIDMSGSMGGLAEDVRGGFNTFLDTISQDGYDYRLTVTLFQAQHGDVLENERALLVIQTDGHENASHDFTKAQIRQLIEAREATDRWAFLYMGAGPSAWDEGAGMGMGKYSMASTQDAGGTRSRYSGLATAAGQYARGASAGETFAVAVSEPGVADKDAAKAARKGPYAGKHGDQSQSPGEPEQP